MTTQFEPIYPEIHRFKNPNIPGNARAFTHFVIQKVRAWSPIADAFLSDVPGHKSDEVYFGVYGINPDGTHEHIQDRKTEESALELLEQLGVIRDIDQQANPLFSAKETVADIAFTAGFIRYYSGNSREDIQTLINWAEEFDGRFNPDVNKDQDWDDYMTAISAFMDEKFDGQKMKE